VKKKKHLTVSLPNTVFFLLKANVSQQQLLCSVVQQQINGEASSHVSNYFQVLLLKQSFFFLQQSFSQNSIKDQLFLPILKHQINPLHHVEQPERDVSYMACRMK